MMHRSNAAAAVVLMIVSATACAPTRAPTPAPVPTTAPTPASAPAPTPVYSRADTLRGSNGSARAWWDVVFYDLHVTVSPTDSSIRGHNAITYRVLQPATEMQIDLQQPLVVDSMTVAGNVVPFRRDGHAFFATLATQQNAGALQTIVVFYHGKPVAAVNPPWDGGFIWRREPTGRPWVATANQGLGASVWWPNKDYLGDEPDSQRVAITVPDPMVDISNGRLRSTTRNNNGTTTYEWFVTSPINNYNITVNAGPYAHFSDSYAGENGTLTLDYWPLEVNLDTARIHWQQVRPMLACFEKWFGPYPWYEDGFKLVETPHLGMEHQSAVAYGNGYLNGYLGRDLSGTGWGLKWDFITIHESAHEWWGNNITMQDQADMWIHESFANYAEGIYAECHDGRTAGAEYIIGSRRNITNRAPIIPAYGVNAEGSGDMYYKGGSLLHAVRQLVNDDEKWRGILRGLNATFRHQTVTGQQVRDFIGAQAGMNLDRIFEQYLETTMIPVLEYRIARGLLHYRWTNVVPGFDMPVDLGVTGASGYARLRATAQWQSVPTTLRRAEVPRLNPDFYVTLKAAAE